MRAARHLFLDLDGHLEDAARAKHTLDADRWREELRPRALRQFAAGTAMLPWSRALLKAVVAELFPDDLFTDLVGNLDRIPQRRWPHVIAIAVALRHSWRRDGLAPLATQLRVRLTTTPSGGRSPRRHTRPSRHRFSGSPRPCQGSRCARPRHAGLPALTGHSVER